MSVLNGTRRALRLESGRHLLVAAVAEFVREGQSSSPGLLLPTLLLLPRCDSAAIRAARLVAVVLIVKAQAEQVSAVGSSAAQAERVTASA